MSICPRCSTQFTCAMDDNTGEQCWCVNLPTQTSLPIYPELSTKDAHCFCPACLHAWAEKHPATDSKID